jgi:hypothetical protein
VAQRPLSIVFDCSQLFFTFHFSLFIQYRAVKDTFDCVALPANCMAFYTRIAAFSARLMNIQMSMQIGDLINICCQTILIECCRYVRKTQQTLTLIANRQCAEFLILTYILVFDDDFLLKGKLAESVCVC